MSKYHEAEASSLLSAISDPALSLYSSQHLRKKLIESLAL